MNHPEPHTTLGTQDTERRQLKQTKPKKKNQTNKQTNKQTKKNTKTKQDKKQNEEKKPKTLKNMDPTRKPGMSSGTHKRLAVET